MAMKRNCSAGKQSNYNAKIVKRAEPKGEGLGHEEVWMAAGRWSLNERGERRPETGFIGHAHPSTY